MDSKYLSFFITIFSILFLGPTALAQTLDAKQSPILLINMDETEDPSSSKKYSLIGRDSIVNGISGKAIYLNSERQIKSFLQIDQTNVLEKLWTEKDFSIEIWVQTKAIHKDFQIIAGNKDWDSGEVKDFTTNAEFGFSRTSGIHKGWVIHCQSDGSWALNIGDGEYRMDYRPTAPRQQINDGEWHQIAFTISREKKEARMYFDGRNVAIYNLGGIADMNSQMPICLASDGINKGLNYSFTGALDEFSLYDYVLSSEKIADHYKQNVPAAKLLVLSVDPVKKLNLMTWNIWHGGRRHGREIGPQQVIDFIKDTGTDIIMMQETYGSGPLIADALGYYFYLASSNISVMSKYPILETKTFYDAFRFGITSIELSKGQKINLASLWIHYLPAWRRDSNKPDATEEKLLEEEAKTRHKEIKAILKEIDSYVQNADNTPLIIGGDYNSPSHMGWTKETASWHNNLVVQWPVSKVMMESGFTDSFREIRPDLNYASPTMTAKRITYRIDYIYYKGRALKAIDSDMHNKYKGIWPSDHPAVTTTLEIRDY